MFAAAFWLTSARQPAAGQTQPTFRTEINFIELPVRVLDGKGNFVRDLKQADFQVFEDAMLAFAAGQSDLSSEGNGTTGDSATILCRNTVRDTVRASTRSDVSIYSIDPRGLQNPGWVGPKWTAAVALARLWRECKPRKVRTDETGGFVATGTNSFNKALDRIVREHSSYYLIGYYSSNDKADPHTPHRGTRKGSRKCAHVTLQVVLDRLGHYLADYAERLPATLATEHHEQRSGRIVSGERVVLESEFGIMRLGGAGGWLGLRDIVSVNGRSGEGPFCERAPIAHP